MFFRDTSSFKRVALISIIMFHARQRTGRRKKLRFLFFFFLEGAYSGSAQFSTPELKSCLALKEVAFFEGHYGVQLENLPTTVQEGQEGQTLPQPGCEKDLSSWARARHRSAEKASLLHVLGSPVDSPPRGHRKNGESALESLRKSDTEMQVCKLFPEPRHFARCLPPLTASGAGERQNIGPRQTWFEAKFQDSWG